MATDPVKVALVTASSAGLGAAIAKALAPDMRVVINYANNADRATQLKKDLDAMFGSRQDSPRFAICRADLGKRAEVDQLVAETVGAMGRLDVVVSNGGWTRIRDFNNLDENVEEDDWDMCFNINVKSHLFLLHAARKHLDETSGSFITIASTAGVKPSGSSIPYAVTKAAQIYMAKCLTHAVGPRIRINSVSPGLMMTDWGRKFPQEKIEKAKNAAALHKLAAVEDVAQAVRMLALSESMTGHNLVVDAGFTV